MTPNPNPSPELLPCPFCGGEATLVTGGRGTLVRCYNDQCISGPEPFNDYGHLQAAVDAWNTRALSQTLPAPGEVEKPLGMKAWAGGDSAPDDWDGGPVKARNGKTVYTPAYWQHRPEPEWSGQWDIVAYTPTLATVAAANDEGVAEQAAQFADGFAEGAQSLYALAARNRDTVGTLIHGEAVRVAKHIAAAIRLLPQGGGK